MIKGKLLHLTKASSVTMAKDKQLFSQTAHNPILIFIP